VAGAVIVVGAIVFLIKRYNKKKKDQADDLQKPLTENIEN